VNEKEKKQDSEPSKNQGKRTELHKQPGGGVKDLWGQSSGGPRVVLKEMQGMNGQGGQRGARVQCGGTVADIQEHRTHATQLKEKKKDAGKNKKKEK